MAALILALWLPLTYLLHVFIHEGAHWLVFRRFGIPARIYVLPSKVNGHWYFGYTRTLDDSDWLEFSEPRRLLFWVAPVFAELTWMVLALGVALFWRWAALEAGAAGFDIAVWILGRSLTTDIQKVRAALG